MRKLHYIPCLLCLIAAALLNSCGDDDDGVMERPDYTSINYEVTLSDEFLSMYTVEVEYKKLSGDKEQARMDAIYWQYKEKQDGTRPIDFSLRVVAKARERVPMFSGKNDEKINLLADVSIEYYTKKTSAKRTHLRPLDTDIEKGNAATYMEAHPTIEIANISTE